MSKFCILRFQKYKIASVAKIERHQEGRFKYLKNLTHPERASEDITWKKYPDKTMTKVLKEVIKEQEKATGKKFRKDGVSLVEFVMTFSPEMESEIDFAEWHKANLKWLSEQFGAENIIRYDTNNMETTRHGHYFVAPIDDNGKLNASRFFGKKSQIVAMQDSYAEVMAQFGLERGKSKKETKARHQTLAEWHKKEEQRLSEEKKEIAREFQNIQKIKETILEDERPISTGMEHSIGDSWFDSLE